ncbi:HAMP domain-containing protein [Clostridium sp. MCC353]|uniref:sensor histidine kinase n=1 Tax=Clostridium sp. MCC353 TaxID=2592646 RepID=UPI001C012FB3|nr:sensor histidine kinase [Clostridium sp. MCC353]MBT9778381.1 HAMP domain-containing protein [Clostridium sp. MCC353]
MKQSINRKLQMSFTCIFIVLIMLICMVWHKMMGDMARGQAVTYFKSTVNSLNEEFDSLLKDTNYISLILSFNASDQSPILTEPDYIETYQQLERDRILTRSVNDFYSYRSYISSILLCGTNGRSFSNGVALTPEELAAMPWFEELDQSGDSGIFIKTHTNYSPEKQKKSYVISVGRKLWANDKHIGYLLVDISYDYINKRLSQAVTDDSVLMIIDDQGGLIYNSKTPIVPAESIYDTEFGNLTGYLSSGEDQFEVETGGKTYLASYKKSDYTNWTTLCLMPMDAIMGDINKTLNMTLMLSAVCLIIGILLIGGFSRYLTRNILKLKSYVDHVDASDLKEVPVIASGDEIEELGASFNQMIKRVNQLMIDLEERKKKERNAEFQALYAQISPHFLSNTLNTIRWMADRQKAGNISELTASLITLLHYSMKNKNQVVTLKEEVEYIKNYLVIQEYRYYGMFDVIFQVEEEAEKCRILKFLIQPLVENSIMHGIAKSQKQGKILISAKIKDGRLIVLVADNGVGFSVENYKQHKTHHIGIDNVRERIELFYGNGYFLKIESKENFYTKVTMELPVIYESV